MSPYKITKPTLTTISSDYRRDYCFDSNDLQYIHNIKYQLNKSKSCLDDIYKHKKRASTVMRLFNPFTKLKYKLSTQLNTRNITNAWIKGYELISNNLPTRADKFVYFDNAAFPGSFILVAHHIINTLYPITDFRWYASSLLPNGKKYIPLEDSFHYIKITQTTG